MFQYWRLYKILSHKNSNQTHLYLQFWMSDSALAWTKLLHFWSSAVMNHLSGLWNTFSWRVLSGSWNSFHNLTFTHKSFVKSYKKLKVKWKWMNLFSGCYLMVSNQVCSNENDFNIWKISHQDLVMMKLMMILVL